MFAVLNKPLAFSLKCKTINDLTKLLSFMFDFALIATCVYQDMSWFIHSNPYSHVDTSVGQPTAIHQLPQWLNAGPQ